MGPHATRSGTSPCARCSRPAPILRPGPTTWGGDRAGPATHGHQEYPRSMDESGDLTLLDDGRPRWRGINHLALVTPDMDGTVRFYHGVLGMRVVATLSNGPMRHYFFEIGDQNTIAFFEWDGADVDPNGVSKPAGIPPTFPTQFDHISFNLPDEQALLALADRLRSFDIGVTEVVDHGFMHSIYFTDPNGIALEA